VAFVGASLVWNGIAYLDARRLLGISPAVIAR
jgi:hypothetical protein